MLKLARVSKRLPLYFPHLRTAAAASHRVTSALHVATLHTDERMPSVPIAARYHSSPPFGRSNRSQYGWLQTVSRGVWRVSAARFSTNSIVGEYNDAGDMSTKPDDHPMKGVRVAVKENFCMRGQRTQCASNMLRGYSSPFTSTAVKGLLGGDAAEGNGQESDESRQTGAFVGMVN